MSGGADNDMLSGGAGGDELSGGAGDDWLLGGEGADLIDGGEGDDVLLGGDGADTFGWSEADLGSAGDDTVDHVDTVKGFNAGEGDTLDVATLLSDMGANAGNVASFFQAVTSGDNVELQVDPTGTGSGWQTFAVVEDSLLADVNSNTDTGF
jgi:Ca2+-binding RTX toxin-like protein